MFVDVCGRSFLRLYVYGESCVDRWLSYAMGKCRKRYPLSIEGRLGPIVSVNIVSECIKCARGWIRIGGLSSGKLYGFVTKQNIEKR